MSSVGDWGYKEKFLFDKIGVHPNVVEKLAFFESNKFICIVTEQMSIDMRVLLHNMKSRMTEKQMKIIFH